MERRYKVLQDVPANGWKKGAIVPYDEDQAVRAVDRSQIRLATDNDTDDAEDGTAPTSRSAPRRSAGEDEDR